jgi:hypothetical protein
MFIFGSVMNIAHRVFSCPETGEDCLAVITRKRLDAEATREVFLSIAEITESLGSCRVLIDLREGIHSIGYFAIFALLDEVQAGRRLLGNKIALLSNAAAEQYDQVFLLSVYLLNQRLQADVFFEINRAIRWLASDQQPPLQH